MNVAVLSDRFRKEVRGVVKPRRFRAMTRSPRICLIDDDIRVREALSFGLDEAGFQVFAAPGAAAGLDLVLREGADAIVTDMNMPGISGDQLIVEARARWPNLPIIAITGSASYQNGEAALLAGADACLVKPFRAQQLVHLLETVMAARSASARAKS